MAQPIILNHNQIGILYQLGKSYGNSLTFTNVCIGPSGGALCDWKGSTDTWAKISNAHSMGCIDVEASREDLVFFLDWFDRQEKDELEFRSQFGTYRPRSEAEKSLFMYLKLAQAFNYPQDIKHDEDNA